MTNWQNEMKEKKTLNYGQLKDTFGVPGRRSFVRYYVSLNTRTRIDLLGFTRT